MRALCAALGIADLRARAGGAEMVTRRRILWLALHRRRKTFAKIAQLTGHDTAAVWRGVQRLQRAMRFNATICEQVEALLAAADNQDGAPETEETS